MRGHSFSPRTPSAASVKGVRGEKECLAGGPRGSKEFSPRRSDGWQLFGLDNGVHFSVYREQISDGRLKAVAEHVRGWLFPPEESEKHTTRGKGREEEAKGAKEGKAQPP